MPGFVRLWGGICLKTVYLPDNKGLGNALKIAVKKCSNELVARMDSDDIAVPDRFEQQIKRFMEMPAVDIVGGDIDEFIDDIHNVTGKRCVPCRDRDIKKYMEKRCPFNHMTVMYKKSAVQKAGGYRDWFWNEDYYLWIRMMQKGCSMENTGTVLVHACVNDGTYQRRGGVRYFKSEAGLQKYMLENRMIGLPTFLINVAERFIIQVLLPNKIRGWVFRKFAREKVV